MVTLSLLQVLPTLGYVASFLLAGLHSLFGGRFRGSWFWIAGQGVNALGACLDLWFPGGLHPVSTVGANTLEVASCALYFHAIWRNRFSARVPRVVFLWGPLAAVCFLAIQPLPYVLRSMVFAGWMALGAGVNGGLQVWATDPGVRPRAILASAPYFVLSLACVVRIILLVPMVGSPEAAGPESMNLVYAASNLFLSTFLLFGYFMLSQLAEPPGSPTPGPPPVLASPAEGVCVEGVEVAVQRASEYGLSPREWEVARLVAEGLPSRSIADRLFIAEGTVKNHLKNLFRKTGCANRADLVRTLFVGDLTPV